MSSRAKQGQGKSGQARPYHAKSSWGWPKRQAKLGQAKPSRARPGQVEPSRVPSDHAEPCRAGPYSWQYVKRRMRGARENGTLERRARTRGAHEADMPDARRSGVESMGRCLDISGTSGMWPTSANWVQPPRQRTPRVAGPVGAERVKDDKGA